VFNVTGSLTYIGSIITKVMAGATWPEKVSAVANCLMVLVTALAACFAWKAWRTSKDSLKTSQDTLTATRDGQLRETVNSYFREFRSYKMGKAISDMWRFHRSTQERIEPLVLSYMEHAVDTDEFHLNTRRSISAFYQELAVLSEGSQALRDIIYSVWARGDLDIIVKVLLPIETIANKHVQEVRYRWARLSHGERAELVSEWAGGNAYRKVRRVKQGATPTGEEPVEELICLSDGWGEVMQSLYRLWDSAPPPETEYPA
jgi:hypothetical protein